jgi:hypothetical protein
MLARTVLTKLKLLFIVIIVLFGIMNIGGFVAFLMDARERRAYLAQLQTPALGFREEKGAWLWRLHLEPLKEAIDTPTGPAVELSAMLGMPLSRLRTCFADDLLNWDLGTSLGRQHVLSTKRMEAALEAHMKLLPPLFGGDSSGIKPTDDADADADAEDAAAPAAPAAAADAEAAALSASAAMMEDFLGTALVLAFLQCAALMPVAQLAERRSAAKRYFAGVTTPAGWEWSKIQTDFVTMVSPGNVNGTKNWLPTARLWRLILSQSPEGFWDASSTTAFALEARNVAETDALPKQSFFKRLSTAATICVTEDMTDAMAYMKDNRLPVDRKPSTAPADDDDNDDCPLTCPRSAIVDSVPAALAAVRDAAPGVDPERVWTTLLCICVLERMKFSFIFGDGDLYPRQERTIVDAGREWVEAQAAAHPALAAALQDGEVHDRASNITRLWSRTFEQRVIELRRCKGIRFQMTRSHVRSRASPPRSAAAAAAAAVSAC